MIAYCVMLCDGVRCSCVGTFFKVFFGRLSLALGFRGVEKENDIIMGRPASVWVRTSSIVVWYRKSDRLPFVFDSS
jgi:hypothetical protein